MSVKSVLRKTKTTNIYPKQKPVIANPSTESIIQYPVQSNTYEAVKICTY